GGTLNATNNGVKFYDDVLVTNGIYPSTKATNTKNFSLATLQSPAQLKVGNELLLAAQKDALAASADAKALGTTGSLASWNNKTIQDTTTITAVHDGL